MHKRNILNIIIAAGILCSPAGCFRNPQSDAEKEFRSLMADQWTASGSDLAYAVCGWPVYRKMKLKNLKLDLFPDSNLKEGRGYADISAGGDGFSCGGKLFFIYDYSYTGGHGYSGGTEIALRLINHESPIDENISNPLSAVPIETGKTIEGELSASGRRLPDDSFVNYYSIEFKDSKPAIKFTDIKGNGIRIKGAVYQDRMHVSQLSESGTRLKPGRAIILITAGEKTGRYSFKITELTEAEKSGLR